jgi:lysozyme
MKISNINDQLRRDEGLRLVPYKDTATPPRITVGWGHNLTDDGGALVPITLAQAEAFLTADIAHATAEITTHLPWALALPDVYRGVITNLVFNMGIGIPSKSGLLAFTHTLDFIKEGQYAAAAAQLLDSKWATEVGDRATRLATQLRTGTWQ